MRKLSEELIYGLSDADWQAELLGNCDWQYNQNIKAILKNGEHKSSRAGDTISLFDLSMGFDLQKFFPLLSGKKINFDMVYAELMWFLRADSNINTLRYPQLWKDWAKEDGDCGRIYGVQWLEWQAYGPDTYEGSGNLYRTLEHKPDMNQLQVLIDTIKKDPGSRRLVVTAWNPAELDQMVLPPCHMFFQCYVREGKYLDLSLWQRSCDMAIGVPFNIASYALLTHLLARETELLPGRFTHHLGDAHIYVHHVEGLQKQIERDLYCPPQLQLTGKGSIWDFAKRDTARDYKLTGYEPHKFIKFPLNV